MDCAPEAGGGIAAFRAFGMDILRPADRDAILSRDPLGLSCFPMTPFVNRITRGAFAFQGEQISLAPPVPPYPLHGYGWRAPWVVDELGPESAVMSWRNDETSAWPWICRTEQSLRIEPDALVVELAVENLDDHPMPASLGLHPYFPAIDEALLEAEADGVWVTDDDLIPTKWVAISEAVASFAKPRSLARTYLDNCYTGFRGEARLSWPRPGLQVTIEAPNCRFMQIYTRGNDGSFCVEAQTAMPDAFNRADAMGAEATGLQIIAPGDGFACTTRFKVART